MSIPFRTLTVLAALLACGDDTTSTSAGAATATTTTSTTGPTPTTTSTTSGETGDASTTATSQTTADATTSTSEPVTSTTAGATSTGVDETSSGDTSTGDASTSDASTTDTELPPGCDPASLFMYLLDADGGLHRFEPTTLERTSLGVLSCPADLPLPMAMTIDRDGDAWVLYADRNIYEVDTETLACTKTPHVAEQQMYSSYALAFSADAIDAPNDTLFITGVLGGLNPGVPALLGRLVGPDLTLEIIGQLSDMSGQQALPDLTGTGDARLFGLFATTPATLSEIDKASGALVDPAVLNGLETGSAWALAFYAGQFWLFTGTAPNGTTEVSTYDPETQVITPKGIDLGVRIVGAGVSTCVPVLPQ